MFGLEVFKTGNKYKKPLIFISRCLRFMSTEEDALQNTQTYARRFSKPLLARSYKPLKGSFMQSLFSDNIDKSIFQYPTVFRHGDTDTVFNQVSEVEAFFSSNLKANITEEICTKLKELELFGLSIHQKYGGAGYTDTEVKFLLECTGINSRISRFLGYHDLGCKMLELHGSEEQKQKYLPRLAEGKSFMTFAYLENGPLINLTKFEGSAIPMEEKKQYLLNANKKWVHNADLADLFLVMVKYAIYGADDEKIRLKFTMFIVDRETPGVTVHKLTHKSAQDFDLFDVTFKDVSVPFDDLLGNEETDGFEVLKSGLSHSFLNDAVLCCCFMKCIIHDVSHFIQERGLDDTAVRGNNLLLENLASMSIYVFGLESAIYMATGRCDTYENFDLFYESILIKTLAINFLQFAIKEYIDIVGRESYKSSGLLEEAMQTLNYLTAFDENIEYLKMMAAAEGLLHAATVMKKKVRILRRPYDYPWEGFKMFFRNTDIDFQNWKPKHKFRMELPSDLTYEADGLEKNYEMFQKLIENIFTEYGSLAMNNDHYTVKFAEAAAFIYGAIASLARASNSICYGFENSLNDLTMARSFQWMMDTKIKSVVNENLRYVKLVEYYRQLGKVTFNAKEYPVEHPLTRNY